MTFFAALPYYSTIQTRKVHKERKNLSRGRLTVDISQIEPVIVKPAEACRMLTCGVTTLYALIKAGELESFADGGSRKITVESIYRYIAKRLAEDDKSPAKPMAKAAAASLRARKLVEA